jgi:membrane-bound lytic murein transglycosylase MltF
MKWISVKERLPELSTKDKWDYGNSYSDKVIVIEQGESYFAKYRQDISQWTVFGRTGNIQVSHWMPLPEPPTE